MTDPNKLALLQAAAQGGTIGIAQEQANQAQAQQGMPAPISAALAQAVQNQGLTGEAATQLNSIENRGDAAGRARGASLEHANHGYQYGLLSALNTFMGNQDNLVLPAIKRELFLEGLDGSGGSSGGGGGGGGGGGSGGGGGGSKGRSSKSKGSSSNEAKSGDWLKQARIDAGLVGSGIRSKDGIPPFLAKASLEAYKAQKGTGLADVALAMPRDIRAQEWAIDHYGATQEDVGKGAPISGFLDQALKALQQTIADKQSYKAYAKATHKAARSTPGDQRKAVQFALALARQNLGRGGNPLVNAGKVVSGAPANVARAIRPLSFF